MKMNSILVFASALALVLTGAPSFAQTTLSGDHIITGDLDVGSSVTPGNLFIKGELGNSAAPSLNVDGDGGVIFRGRGGQGQMPAVTAGPILMWYPKKAAFWVGRSYGAVSESSIGEDSVQLGSGSASGIGSFSVNGVSLGNYSVSMQGGYAEGDYSFALGYESYTLGDHSFAQGYLTVAYGNHSFVSGLSSNATGKASFSTGIGASSFGDASAAFGSSDAESYSSLTVGRYNIGGGNPEAWIEMDPVFEIGIGGWVTREGEFEPTLNKRNALTVFKSGKIKMERQGDILMGEFGNEE